MKRYASTSSVPLALAVFLATDSYDHNPDPNTISVTTLLKPTRQIVLASRLPPDNAPLDLVAQMSNRLGSAMHDGIERSWKNNYVNAMLSLGYPQSVIKRILINPTFDEMVMARNVFGYEPIPIYMEQRMSKKVGKWTVTGKFDFIGEGRVTDFKSASVWSYMNQVNADKQSKQGSLYRWLDPEKITQDQMDIIHIFMDWRRAQVAADPKYPPQHFHTQVLDLMPYAETQRFVVDKLADIDRQMLLKETEITDCDEEALWRSKPKHRYYKNGFIGSKKSTKNFDTAVDAFNYMHNENGGKGEVITTPGQVKACNYCAAYPICSQKDRLIASGHLLKQI